MNGMSNAGRPFGGGPPLIAKDAVAAIILCEDGRYLLQLRDDTPEIWFPAHWGLFGGAIDPGEEPFAALQRELREELQLNGRTARRFVQFEFDLRELGQGRVWRAYYTIQTTAEERRSLRLGEGAAMKTLLPEEIFGKLRLVPYDAFALWLHAKRSRFTTSEVCGRS